MKFFKLFVLLAAVLAAPAALAAGDAEAGKEKATPCAACHGQDGNSPSGQYPSLAGQGEPYLLEQLKAFKSGARNNAIMAGMVANLSDQDMQDLAAYFADQSIQPGQADPELVEAGERLYRGGDMKNGIPACSGCHGPGGQGVAAAHFPALGGQHAEYLEAQLKAFRAAGRGDLGDNLVVRENDPQAMMRTIAGKMSDGQIKAVASFLSGLSVEEEGDAE
ncbi:cytochrome c4 [Alcanivorax sp. N3-2A]|nr:cytochrome c4 [Alcanivorax sp. N3-2A]|tara:strand:- start:13256 stop:13915 length:660 start_codon:yes stop_codon:yes gene_type:complete